MTIRQTDPRVAWTGPYPPRRGAAGIAIGCLLVTFLAAGLLARAQPAGGPQKLVLFDGKSLDGWSKTGFSKAGDVQVDDGKIVMSAGGSMTGITSTRRDLPRSDYELSYEAMRLAGGDFFAAATFPVGKSYITLVNGGWGGHVTGLSSLDGMDASENETTHSIAYKEKTWYRFRIRVTDAVIRCWIDDKEVAAVNYQDRRVGTRIETRANEPLGFATWETAGAVRGVEIRRLRPEEIAATNQLD